MNMRIKPIKNDADYQAALAEVERLFDAAPNTPKGDRLEVWTTLISAYEEQHFPISTPDPVEAIRYFAESRGLKERDLAPYLGSRSQVKEVLDRKRALTFEMIRKLHQGLGISADLLIQPYEVLKAAA